VIAVAHVRIVPEGILRIEGLSGDAVAAITRDVGRDARRRVPVDTGELEASIRTVHRPGSGVGRVFVGTDHWQPTEYGSAPHKIRSTGPWPLRNRETGDVFGRVVNHPGTPAQPFMRPALYRKRAVNL
jgi:hypothetical protein